MNIQPNSHAHCQVAQAKAQTKAWQRVCLSYSDKIETDPCVGDTCGCGFRSQKANV